MRGAIPNRETVVSDAEASETEAGEARAETDPIADDTPDTSGITVADEPEADTDEIPLPPPPEGHGHHGHHRRPPVGLIVTIAIMSVLLIAVSTLAAYLWHVSEEWEQQVNEITDVSYGLGADVAEARDALTAAQEQISLLSDQLATAKDSVTRLQAENAQWGDDAAFAQEKITVLEASVSEGLAVSTSLIRCIEGHDQLLTYIDALASPTPTPSPGSTTAPEPIEASEVASYRQSVVDLCTSARDASQAFHQSIAP